MRQLVKYLITLFCRIKYCKRIKAFSNSFLEHNVFHKDGNICIGHKTIIKKSTIGRYTTFGDNCKFVNAEIGSFCSIGSNVRLVSSTHPTRQFVSSSPFFYRDTNVFNEELIDKNGRSLIVGDDVWIGDNSLIKGGITISDGAIVGMGSVVVKDVPPYAIVAGNPARIIRYRFTEEQIKILRDINWAKKDIEWIKNNRSSFGSVDFFINAEKKE